MKTLKPTFLLILSTLFFFSSCRTEDEISIDPPPGQNLVSGSTVSDLLNRVSLKDGSKDNIIDKASCLTVQLPVKLIVNGITITVNDEDGYEEIEDLLDDVNTPSGTIATIVYPITIINKDFSTKIVNSDAELSGLAANCKSDNELDDDIECIDFVYPISASVFNQRNEIISTIIINNDNEMYEFIDDLDDFTAVSINFPIKVILADLTEVTINNLQELQQEIELADDTCDEDDDNNYNDDDCENCTTTDLTSLFADCTVWKLGDLERNDRELDPQYANYSFSFNANGTLTATENGIIKAGTWTASGTGNAINFALAITDLPDFNGTWKLSEIEREFGEVEIEFYIGDDELSFYSTCGSGNTSGDALSDTLIAEISAWAVSSFVAEGVNETSAFTGYQLKFSSNGAISAQKDNSSTNGTWSSQKNATELIIDFNTENILDELDEDWKVVSISSTQIRLQDIDNGMVKSTLTLTKL